MKATEDVHPIKMWTKHVPVDEKVRQQLYNTTKMSYLPLAGSYARCTRGQKLNDWQRYPDQRDGYTGSGGCRYWLRHDSGANFANRFRPAGKPPQTALQNRKRGATSKPGRLEEYPIEDYRNVEIFASRFSTAGRSQPMP